MEANLSEGFINVLKFILLSSFDVTYKYLGEYINRAGRSLLNSSTNSLYLLILPEIRSH